MRPGRVVREDEGMSAASLVTVAVCQFAPTADRRDNVLRIAEHTRTAAARGAELIVFPEYASYFVAPFDVTLRENAEELDGPFVQSLRAIADEHDVTIVAGLVERGGDAALVRNALVAVDATGIRARYRKQHLYDAFGTRESEWLSAGDIGAPETFEVGGIRFGLMTCYDLRFPEVGRTLVDAGADALIVPAEWVRGPLKEHHWVTLLEARAIENTAYVIAADHPAPVGVGHSAVIDPQGVRIAGVGSEEGMALAELDAEVIARTREVNPVLRVRRYRVVPAE